MGTHLIHAGPGDTRKTLILGDGCVNKNKQKLTPLGCETGQCQEAALSPVSPASGTSWV